MSKNLEELKKVRKNVGVNMQLPMSYLIPILENFEKRIKELEKHNLDNSKFVVRETYFPNQDRKKVLE